MNERRETHLPELAWRLVWLCTAPGDRDTVLGDLEEEFRYLTTRRGDSAARHWYRSQVLRSAGSLLGLRISRSPIARSCQGAAAGATLAIVAASLFGLLVERWLGSPSDPPARTMALVVTGCALLSSTCGGWVSTLATRGRNLGALWFVGGIVVTPEVLHAGLARTPWSPLYLALALTGAVVGLTLGGRLALAGRVQTATTGEST